MPGDGKTDYYLIGLFGHQCQVKRKKKFSEKSCDIKVYITTQPKLIINPLSLPGST